MSFFPPVLLTFFADTQVSTVEPSVEESLGPKVATEIGFNNSWANLFWYFLSFLLILALAVWGLKWIAGKMGRIRGRHLKLLESLYLGPNRGLHLIRVANQVFLIGLADRYMRLIAEIDDPQLLAEIEKELATSGRQGGKDFSHYLQKVLKAKGRKEDTSLKSNLLEDELRKIKDLREKQGEEDE